MVSKNNDQGSNTTDQNQQAQDAMPLLSNNALSRLAPDSSRSNRRGPVSGRHYPRGSPEHEIWRLRRNERMREHRARVNAERHGESRTVLTVVAGHTPIPSRQQRTQSAATRRNTTSGVSSQAKKQQSGNDDSSTQGPQGRGSWLPDSVIASPSEILGTGTSNVEGGEQQDIELMSDNGVYERRYTYPDPTMTNLDLFMEWRRAMPPLSQPSISKSQRLRSKRTRKTVT